MTTTQNITCISCPVGCRMTVTLEDGVVTRVENNTCKRGDTYARQECVAPMRMVTAVAPVEGSEMPVSIKTENPIPKEKITACMDVIRAAHFTMPIMMGDVLIHDVAGTGVDLVATKSIV